jgi:cytochrome c oxidase cbb3-type subunit IV
MDINTIRIAVTVFSFVVFIGILLWAYSSGVRKGFDEAAMLPFADEPDGNANRQEAPR